MAATTTPSINSILDTLRARLPEISFAEGQLFSWDPTKNHISYNLLDDFAIERLLHESGHAICGHTEYSRDITLLEMERDAWEAAKQLGQELDITINEDTVQDHLDDYRLWLHARSTCPSCSQLGIQQSRKDYVCPICQATWRVNDSRNCQLRRYKK